MGCGGWVGGAVPYDGEEEVKIYIAGPYSKGDVAQNVKAAVMGGDYVTRLGHVPYIPHLTHFWHLLMAHEYQFWLDYDLVWLAECDAILRLSGESAGADAEVEFAKSRGMPVFHSVFEIPKACDG